MSDMRSGMPDLKEVAAMAGKLFNDLKKSVGEIVSDYKTKHCASDEKSAEKKADKKEKS